MVDQPAHPKFIRDKIVEAIQPFMFENIGPDLYASIKDAVMDVLIELYKENVLVGDIRKDAFFVVCDSRNNYAPECGVVNVDVGIALNEPGHFTLIRYLVGPSTLSRIQ